MIQIKTKNGIVGLIEIIYINGYIGLKEDFDSNVPINLKNILIGKFSELDAELEEFVDKEDSGYVDYILFRVGYLQNYVETPKESFISLIKSQHPEFDEFKEYLLIKLL